MDLVLLRGPIACGPWVAVSCEGMPHSSPNLESFETEVEGMDVKSEESVGATRAMRFHLAV